MGVDINTKAVARQLEELRQELSERCPDLSKRYDFSLMVASTVFEKCK